MTASEGPSVDGLTHRLSETPAAFLREPRIGRRGDLHVGALVGDVLLTHGLVVSPGDLEPFVASGTGDRNWLRLVAVGTWLAHSEDLGRGELGPDLLDFFLRGPLKPLARLVSADLFTTDPDRREELARLLLHHLGLRPEGETEDQAADRLDTVNSVERARVLAQMKAKRERAEKLRKEMAAKRAREAAAKYSRE